MPPSREKGKNTMKSQLTTENNLPIFKHKQKRKRITGKRREMKTKDEERVNQRSKQILLSATKILMTALVPLHPLVAEIWMHSVSESPNFV